MAESILDVRGYLRLIGKQLTEQFTGISFTSGLPTGTRYPYGAYSIRDAHNEVDGEKRSESRKYLWDCMAELLLDIHVQAAKGEAMEREIDRIIFLVQTRTFHFSPSAPFENHFYTVRVKGLFTPLERPRIDPAAGTTALITIPVIIEYEQIWKQKPTE